MREIRIIVLLLLFTACDSKKPAVIEVNNAVLIKDTPKLVNEIDSWIEEPLQYKGKIVMEWDIDDLHYGRIEKVYDSTGAIYGLIDRIKRHGNEMEEVAQELERVRGQLRYMHTTGKCPLGEQWYDEVTTDSFTLISGCYTRQEHERELNDTCRPRLEIQATITKK